MGHKKTLQSKRAGQSSRTHKKLELGCSPLYRRKLTSTLQYVEMYRQYHQNIFHKLTRLRKNYFAFGLVAIILLALEIYHPTSLEACKYGYLLRLTTYTSSMNNQNNWFSDPFLKPFKLIIHMILVPFAIFPPPSEASFSTAFYLLNGPPQRLTHCILSVTSQTKSFRVFEKFI